jgi:hypothetical protein
MLLGLTLALASTLESPPHAAEGCVLTLPLRWEQHVQVAVRRGPSAGVEGPPRGELVHRANTLVDAIAWVPGARRSGRGWLIDGVQPTVVVDGARLGFRD